MLKLLLLLFGKLLETFGLQHLVTLAEEQYGGAVVVVDGWVLPPKVFLIFSLSVKTATSFALKSLC